MSSFETFGLHPHLIAAIEDKGWELPRDVQDESIPIILGGSDVLIASETGSGKTAALALPMLQLINEFTTSKSSFNFNNSHVIPTPPTFDQKHVGFSASGCDPGWLFQKQQQSSSSTQDLFSGSDITARWAKPGFWGNIRSNLGACSGKYYFETTILEGTTIRIGCAMKSAHSEIGQDINSIGWGSTGVLVFGKQFFSLPGQNVIKCSEEHNGYNTNPTIICNDSTQQQTVEMKQLISYRIGDTIGIGMDFDINQIHLYKITPSPLSLATSQQPNYDVYRVAILDQPFFPNTFYFPSISTKDGTVQVNLSSNFLNPYITTTPFLPFAQCVLHYQSIPQSHIQPPVDATHTSAISTDRIMNENEVKYRLQAEQFSQQQFTYQVKGIIIAPTPELCRQLQSEMISFSTYLKPQPRIELCCTTSDVTSQAIFYADILIGTVGLLESLFGTRQLPTPQFHYSTGLLQEQNNNTNTKRPRLSLEILQPEFNGLLHLPTTQSIFDTLYSSLSNPVSSQEPLLLEQQPYRKLQHKRQTISLSEKGPPLANCIFFTIDEADSFGDRLNTETLHRLTQRIKRDKDRHMTCQFLTQFSTTPPLLSSHQFQQRQLVPQCQAIMCSATIDQEKMGFLYPLLHSNYSTIHLRERYELPKGLLHGIILLHGHHALQQISTQTRMGKLADSISNNNNTPSEWPFCMISERFLDSVHEYGVPLPRRNPFHILNPSLTSAITPPFTNIPTMHPPDHYSVSEGAAIIASQATKMYKFHVLGQLLSHFTTNPSQLQHHLDISRLSRLVAPNDLSHLTLNNSIDIYSRPTEEEPLPEPAIADSALSTQMTSQLPPSSLDAVQSSPLNKILIFCRTNNDCIRIALFISFLIEQNSIHLPSQSIALPTESNCDEEEDITHQNKRKNQNQKNNKSSQQMNFTTTLTQSSFPSSSLLKYQYHSSVGCVMSKGQSSQQINHIFQQFQSNAISFLVCTDIGARGLDFVNVPLIINFNLPEHPEVYVQRAGRTARNGKFGLCLTLANSLPEYIWYHTSTNHPVNECESILLPNNSKIQNEKAHPYSQRNIENNGLLPSLHHPCVRVQHETVYLDDIQEKLQIRLPIILPQDCFAAGYDGLAIELFSRRGLEDLCARVHQEQSDTVLEQNQNLLKMQLQAQEMYFQVLLQCSHWNKLIRRTNSNQITSDFIAVPLTNDSNSIMSDNDFDDNGHDSDSELSVYALSFESDSDDDYNWI